MEKDRDDIGIGVDSGLQLRLNTGCLRHDAKMSRFLGQEEQIMGQEEQNVGAGGAKRGAGEQNVEQGEQHGGRGQKVMKIPSIFLYIKFLLTLLEKEKWANKWGRDIDHFDHHPYSSNLSTKLLAFPSGRIFWEHSSYVSQQQALGTHPCTSIPDMFGGHVQACMPLWDWVFPQPKNRSTIGCCPGIPPTFPGSGIPSMLSMPSDTF